MKDLLNFETNYPDFAGRQVPSGYRFKYCYPWWQKSISLEKIDCFYSILFQMFPAPFLKTSTLPASQILLLGTSFLVQSPNPLLFRTANWTLRTAKWILTSLRTWYFIPYTIPPNPYFSKLPTENWILTSLPILYFIPRTIPQPPTFRNCQLNTDIASYFVLYSSYNPPNPYFSKLPTENWILLLLRTWHFIPRKIIQIPTFHHCQLNTAHWKLNTDIASYFVLHTSYNPPKPLLFKTANWKLPT